MVAQENDLEVKYIKVNEDFTLDLDDLSDKLSSKTMAFKSWCSYQ